MDPVYPSKLDGWLVAVIWVSNASLVAGALVMLATDRPTLVRCALAAFMLAMCVLSTSVLHGTRYTVTSNEVRVRSGPFRWRVPLAAIESVVSSRDPISSPACSLDRLRVAYRDAQGNPRALLLSPDDKVGFLAALAARNPALRLDGDRLAPRS